MPPAFRERRGAMQEGVWELGRFMTVGPESNRFNVFGVHVTAALVVSSLFASNSEVCPSASIPCTRAPH